MRDNLAHHWFAPRWGEILRLAAGQVNLGARLRSEEKTLTTKDTKEHEGFKSQGLFVLVRSDSPIVGAPVLDRFFDFGVGELLVESSGGQGGEFGIGGEAQGE